MDYDNNRININNAIYRITPISTSIYSLLPHVKINIIETYTPNPAEETQY